LAGSNSSAIVDAALIPVPEINMTVLSRASMTPRPASFVKAAATPAEVGSTNRPSRASRFRAVMISSSVTATV